MDDLEKNRIEYITKIEQQLAHALQRVSAAEEDVLKWKPSITYQEVQGKVIFTFSMGGRSVKLPILNETFKTTGSLDIATALNDGFHDNLIFELLQPIIMKQVEKIVNNFTIVGKN